MHKEGAVGMVKSMTGYGRAERVVDGRTIAVEVRSVNHRYFEFSSRVPRAYGFLEERLKSLMQKQIARGKVDVFVSIEESAQAPVEVVLNRSLALAYAQALRELADVCELPREEVNLHTLSRFGDLFSVQKTPENEDALWSAVEQIALEALDAFVSMRMAEGERLKKDVEDRLDRIAAMVGLIEERSPQLVNDYRERLEARIQELLGDRQVDEQRLLTEVAIFADKTAVAEETVRLRSHLDQFKAMIASDQAVGRKLDFLIQEMNREVNTIGSKIQDIEVTQTVVDCKAEIEKIREQIQNIE